MKFRDALRNLTGASEVRIPVATLPRPKPIEVEYIYVEGKPRSHRLQFRKGRAPKFLMGLSRHGEDLRRLCSALENATRPDPSDAENPGFWTRFILRVLGGGTPVSCREAIEPEILEETVFGLQATTTHRFRLAHIRRGGRDSLLLLATKEFKAPTQHRIRHGGFRLSVPEADLLARQLRAFLAASGAFGA